MHAEFVFDGMWYVDLLMGDLGLEWRRKKGWWWGQRWWREVLERYGPGDYRGGGGGVDGEEH